MAEGTLARPKQGVAKMPEVSGNTGQVGGSNTELQGGVYRHPATKEEIIALTDPVTGDAQARGFVRAGFEWVRDVKPGDVKEVGLNSEEYAAQPERKLETDADMLKGLRARLAQLEAAEAKRNEADKQELNPTTESQLRAQLAADEQALARGTDNSGNVETSGGVNTEATPSADRKEATSSKKDGK